MKASAVSVVGFTTLGWKVVKAVVLLKGWVCEFGDQFFAWLPGLIGWLTTDVKSTYTASDGVGSQGFAVLPATGRPNP